MGTRTNETKGQGSVGKTSYMNVHKATLRSQLSIFDMGSFSQAHPHLNDPPERADMDSLKRPTRTK